MREQLPGPEYVGLMLQFTPESAGSVSVSDAEVTVAVPVLVTVIVYPTLAPAPTVDALAVLLTASRGVADWPASDATSDALKARLYRRTSSITPFQGAEPSNPRPM